MNEGMNNSDDRVKRVFVERTIKSAIARVIQREVLGRLPNGSMGELQRRADEYNAARDEMLKKQWDLDKKVHEIFDEIFRR